MGSKYERLTTFSKEQRSECKTALLEREKIAKIFYYRHQKSSAMDKTQVLVQNGDDKDNNNDVL